MNAEKLKPQGESRFLAKETQLGRLVCGRKPSWQLWGTVVEQGWGWGLQRVLPPGPHPFAQEDHLSKVPTPESQHPPPYNDNDGTQP